jgi:hypothetical protein
LEEEMCQMSHILNANTLQKFQQHTSRPRANATGALKAKSRAASAKQLVSKHRKTN